MPTDSFLGKNLFDGLTYADTVDTCASTRVYASREAYLEEKIDKLKKERNELLSQLCQTENRFRTLQKEVELPEQYIINKNATILFWKNGKKTIVKRASDDEFNARLGFLTAFFQHYCGMSKNKANKYLANLQVEGKEDDNKICNLKELKVGDKVFVKKNLKVNQVYGDDVFIDAMLPLKGKEVTIMLKKCSKKS